MGGGELHATIVRLLAAELGVPEQEVERAQSLRKDLGMDSIAAASLLFALEEELSVEFGEIPEIDSLGELEAKVREWLETSG